MSRWSKLTFASVALALLVAGGVRRWVKEHGWPTSIEWGPIVVDLSEPRSEETPSLGVQHAVAEQAEAGGINDRGAVQAAAAHWAVSPLETPSIPSTGLQDARAAYPEAPPSVPSPSLPPEITQRPFGDLERPLAESSTVPTPPSQPAPPPAPTHYVIRPNDSFWTISQRVYGTGRYFQALFEHNRRLCPQPDHLPPGVTIETPPMHVLEKNYPDLFR